MLAALLSAIGIQIVQGALETIRQDASFINIKHRADVVL